jgi:glycosyltransferase involved in cell wall biosynthesis
MKVNAKMEGLTMANNAPPVSIGMPVYNGEKYIKNALESILNQTFTDFELIISDNASTDGTRRICEAYASMDPRIRYYRSERNRGASWNFNRVFQLSSGKYFKWVAHDDLHAPDFLSRCFEILEKEPSVLLCHSRVKIIDEDGNFIQDYGIRLNTGSHKPHERCYELLRKHLCYPIFGLIRSDALRMTPLYGNYAHCDEILLLRLGLLGRFHEIPEFLFFARKHPEQSISQFCPNYLSFAEGDPQKTIDIRPDYYGYTIFFDPGKKGKILFPHWRVLREILISIWKAPLGWHERLLCHLNLLKQHNEDTYLLINDLKIAFQMSLRRKRGYPALK